MTIKNAWNWKIFLLCPFLSFYYRCNGYWIFLLPAIIWGTLLILIYARIVEWLFVLFLMIMNALYLFLYISISEVASHFIDRNLLNNSNILIIIVILYYLMCNILIAITSEKYLSRKMSLTSIRHEQWSKMELLMIIPSAFLVVIINLVNYLVINMGMQVMP
jgi:hypothetical protein